MSFHRSIAAARAFRRSDEPSPNADREVLALDWPTSIRAAASFSGMAAGGGTTQTAVNRQAGAASQMAELGHGKRPPGHPAAAAPWIAPECPWPPGRVW